MIVGNVEILFFNNHVKTLTVMSQFKRDGINEAISTDYRSEKLLYLCEIDSIKGSN